MKAVDKFKEITGYDIRSFFDDISNFIRNDYNKITLYYNGGDLDGAAFGNLDRLYGEASRVQSMFTKYSAELKTSDMWDVLDAFEEVYGKLDTVKNTGKWIRSSKVGAYNQSFFLDRTLNNNENFEDVAESLGSRDSQNEWMEIAVSNLVKEEDYTENTSPIFKVKLNQNNNYQITNVVDSLVDKRILGKDIAKQFRFENGDVAVVSYNDAIEQTIDTIIKTLTGDIPEFPLDGISNEFIGTNVSAIQYPTLFRNISSMFAKDDRFKEVTLLDLKIEGDSVMMSIKIVTVNNDVHTTNINI